MKLVVVLVSLLAVAIAGAVQAAPAATPAAAGGPVAADFRDLDPDNTLVIDTTKGQVIVELIPEAAPNHVARIKELARARLYDGLSFFRVIDDFMAQTGDPQNTGLGHSDKPNLAAEFSFRRGKDMPLAVFATTESEQAGFFRSLPVVGETDADMAKSQDGKVEAFGIYCPGVLGMARSSDPDSGNSQFFLMRQSHLSLDAQYTAFGRVVSGLDVVRAITVGEPPENPDRMTQVRVLADIPKAQRPRVRVMDTAGPAFKALVAQAQAAQGADFSICNVDIPVQVAATH